MRRFLLSTALCLCAGVLLSGGASAELIAYEGFDIEGIAAGDSVTNAAGATSFGWKNPIRISTSAPETAKFVADSLVGLAGTPATRGGSVIQTSSNCRFYRDLSEPMVEGTFYASFLLSAGQNIALDFSNGDWNSNVKASIGVGGSATDGPKLTVGSSSSHILAPRNEVHFYVVKIELASGAGTVSVFVDPDIQSPEPATADASFATSFSSGFSFWADRFRFSRFNSNTNGYLDEIRLGRTFHDVVVEPGHAINVAPAHNAVDVPLNTMLEWTVGNDPNIVNGIQPWDAVQGYYVYFGDDQSQMTQLTPSMLPLTTTSISTPTLEKDMTYFWQVVEILEKPEGGLYPLSDPNNVWGPVWSFKTPLTIPVIVEDLAPEARLFQGTDVTFSLTVDSVSTPHFAWYYSADSVIGNDIAIGTDAPELTLAGIDVADQGYYYCIVSNSSGVDVISVMTRLVVNRMLAWYQFENNLDDSIGTNDAITVGQIPYIEGIVTDGQAYAADPNGSAHGELPTGAYPKAGIGNGLERFTYSAWVKLAPGQKGNLLGGFNTGSNTAMRLTLNDGFDISFYLRQEGGSAVVADTSGLGIADNQWHLVTMTYNGGSVVTYLDGVAVRTNGTTISNFVDWEYLPLPILAINSRGTIAGKFSGSVDDLRIYNYGFTAEEVIDLFYAVTGEKICLYGNPAADISGNCTVDLEDIAIIAESWLETGLYPNN
jgi:hypothetical protein